VPDFIALRGDPSDGLPGAKGVGPKSAASLLQKYPTLEDAIADGRFAAQAEELRLYRRIATMDSSAPLPELADQRPTWEKAAALAGDWELRQLSTRLGDLAKASAQAGST
jgi:DNA polymerase-1